MAANLVQVRGLRKLHVHQRPAPEVDAVGQASVHRDGNQSGQEQGERKADEVPLFPHPVNLGFVKELHRFALPLRFDTAELREVPANFGKLWSFIALTPWTGRAPLARA